VTENLVRGTLYVVRGLSLPESLRTTHHAPRTTHLGEAMKIYTKTGDAGETGLFGGGRVPKDDPRVQAYGDVDETNAAIGFAGSLEPQSFESSLIQTIQRDLFTIGAELATPDPTKLAKALAHIRTTINASDVGALEDVIDNHEAKLLPLKNFILPGGTPKAAAFHLARTVCRRAERSVVALARDQKINASIVHYLNRLSDLLFVLARAVNAQAGRPDIAW
jgi:cob(I)alamin adenosyltransferase